MSHTSSHIYIYNDRNNIINMIYIYILFGPASHDGHVPEHQRVEKFQLTQQLVHLFMHVYTSSNEGLYIKRIGISFCSNAVHLEDSRIYNIQPPFRDHSGQMGRRVYHICSLGNQWHSSICCRRYPDPPIDHFGVRGFLFLVL